MVAAGRVGVLCLRYQVVAYGPSARWGVTMSVPPLCLSGGLSPAWHTRGPRRAGRAVHRRLPGLAGRSETGLTRLVGVRHASSSAADGVCRRSHAGSRGAGKDLVLASAPFDALWRA